MNGKKLKEELEKADSEKSLQDFLLESNIFKNNQGKKPHNKVRKVFSLPVKNRHREHQNQKKILEW